MAYIYESRQERARFEQLRTKLSPGGSLLHVSKILVWAAQQYGSATALVCQDISISYQELYARVVRCARQLQEQGIKQGDTVLVWLHNSLEFYIAYFAVLQLGAVVAPLNVYLTQAELLHIIDDAQAKLLITSYSFKERIANAHIGIAIMYEEEMGMLKELAVTDSVDWHQPIERPLSTDAIALILYTSGTTGLPKGVALSSNNVLINALQAIVRNPHDITTIRVLCALPLFHSFTQNCCIWAPIIYGATVIVVPRVERRMILQAFQYKPTMVLGVPALYGLFCLMRTAPLAEVQLFISGGDALPNKIRAAFALIYNRSICNGYGMTETSPLIAVDMDDMLEPTSCVGRPCVDTVIDIRDGDLSLLQGKTGQLWVQGPQVMLGYHNAPQATEAIMVDGWLNTGDLAYINQRGKIVIAGRDKDLIKHKGFNIYPQEIENVIMGHPLVIRVGVIGVADPAGQVPVAYVQVRHETEQLYQELRHVCSERLAAYKIPKEFVILAHELPLTSTGKVDKKQLLKDYEANTTT